MLWSMAAEYTSKEKITILHELISATENAIERFEADGYIHTAGMLENMLGDLNESVQQFAYLKLVLPTPERVINVPTS